MKRVCLILFVLAFINFMAFFLIAYRIGGDALNGKVENGRYFVASHGRLTEVSAGIFEYSLWHARSLFIIHPLGMLAAALLAIRLSPRIRNLG